MMKTKITEEETLLAIAKLWFCGALSFEDLELIKLRSLSPTPPIREIARELGISKTQVSRRLGQISEALSNEIKDARNGKGTDVAYK